ncbi:MAG: DUF1329 domain-containing protein [Deltaproteobacteria bacterium]|nr:DUF1329 domain-containing protein [Deltaproteobacteria bacterium]
MKYFLRFIQRYMALLALAFLAGLFVPAAAPAWEPPDPKTYLMNYAELEKTKAYYDDPRSLMEGKYSLKSILPKELYEKLVFPMDEMKKEWAGIVGFKAPDVVGKKAPEVKPGKYTYKDLEKYPGFKELFGTVLGSRLKPGGPPFAGNVAEFEIVPTVQWYHSLPVSKATKENSSKIKVDSKGYLTPTSWEGGYPFPRPSGPHKALQIMYNVEKRYLSWDGSFVLFNRYKGYRKDLSEDYDGGGQVRHLKLGGRLALEPYGWLDERAKKRGEIKTFVMDFLKPRDSVGTAMSALYYLDSNKADQLMAYVPQLRRVRMLSSSDSQDPVQGQDLIYDDSEGFLQKLSPTIYPYEWKVLEETELLLQVFDGTEYVTKKGLEMRNVKFMRRPVYVIEGRQLDKNYVYSKRVFIVDRENFLFYEISNYDQKGRLYRTFQGGYEFEPDMGVFHLGGVLNLMKDHVDLHSNIVWQYQIPAFWGRKGVSLEQYMGAK